MELMVILFGLLIVAAPFMAWASLSKISALKQRMDKLEEIVRLQQKVLAEHHQRDVQLAAEDDEHKMQEQTASVVQGAQVVQTAPITTESISQITPIALPEVDATVQAQAVPTGVPAAGSEKMAPTFSYTTMQPTQGMPQASQVTQEQKQEMFTESVEVAQQEVPAQGALECNVELSVVTVPVEKEAEKIGKSAQAAVVAKPIKPAKPTLIDMVLRVVRQWFATGNVPVKIGILVLFAGVAALLKYATEQGWLSISLPMRLVGVSVVAVGALVFAWRKREQHRVFSLSLQGGALGILLLTAFAAFKYEFIAPGLAFVVTVALIALMGVLAVVQNAMILAVFAIFAGFLAPIWLSTGSNNHVALFTYYAVLNAGVLGMAWWRPWRHLNMLGFAFTFGIGTLWGTRSYEAAKFASTEPFLLLFFVFYLLIPILYARKFVGSKRDVVDALLVFGTPLVAFSLQAVLLQDNRYALAGNALGLGVLYAGLSWLFTSKARMKGRMQELVPAYMALAGGFITLAVPLAFSALQTSCIYALEGAALVWWGVRQSRTMSQLSGLGLQLLGAGTYLYNAGFGARAGQVAESLAISPIANAMFINMVMLACAAFFSAWCYYHDQKEGGGSVLGGYFERTLGTFNMPSVLYLWSLVWWCAAGVREIYTFADRMHYADFGLMFAVLSAWLAAEVSHRIHKTSHKGKARFGLLRITTCVGLALPVVLCLWQVNVHNSPLTGLGWMGWLMYLVLGSRSLYCWGKDLNNVAEDKTAISMALFTQFLWWPTWALVATCALRWLGVRQGLGESWFWALQALPLLTLAGLSLWRWAVLRQPLGMRFDALRDHLQAVLFAVLVCVWAFALTLPAGSAPLPWLPLFNPIELCQLAVLGLTWCWLRGQGTQRFLSEAQQMLLLSVMSFLMVSVVTLRMVHHWGDVSWWMVLSNPVAQMWLSMVWAVLGGVLVWRGIRGKHELMQFAGMGMQLLAGGAFVASLTSNTVSPWMAGMLVAGWPVLNMSFINMLVLALAGLSGAWGYHRYLLREGANRKPFHQPFAIMFYLWGLGWWCAAGVREIYGHADILNAVNYLLVFFAATGILAALIYRRLTERLLALTVCAAVVLGVWLIKVQMGWQEHLFAQGGWLAWVCFGVLSWFAIGCLRGRNLREAKVAQLAWWLAWVFILFIELLWVLTSPSALNLAYNSGWAQMAVALPWLVLLAATVWNRSWTWVCKPLGVEFDVWREMLQKVLFTGGLLLWLYAMVLPSDSAPLPWLPVLNPIDLLQLAFAAVLLYWLKGSTKDNKARTILSASTQVQVLSLAGFLLVTVMTLRGVYHLGGEVAWDFSLISTRLAQTALSVVWSVLGVLAWIGGSRRGRRELWWAGAVLMGVVLVKLLIVDRQNLGNIPGIVSFLAYGVLCVVVGYFAPAPPKEVLERQEQDKEGPQGKG